MKAAGANVVCVLGTLSLLCTLGQGPTYVIAGIGERDIDPLFFYRGNSNGARPPRRAPSLSTIYEEGHSQREDGRAALERDPSLRGSGGRPMTRFRFQPPRLYLRIANAPPAPPPAPPPNPPRGRNLLGALNRQLRRLNIQRPG
ncbi:uncharacterized protein LOC119165866 isoform X2 [Rhipicephalus microplus]|uniref:uncharacterized protein LOC119165866 isoform X2 n=1 Tax=Rhipicephalus microplus TaxID=6941 RepID=UPI003F6B49E8